MNGHILSIGLTCLVVAVAWAKKIKFAALKDEERYEANVDLMGEPTNRDRKKGVAVIMTMYIGVRHMMAVEDKVHTIPWKEHGASHDKVYPFDTSID